jgi:hypothetical protein
MAWEPLLFHLTVMVSGSWIYRVFVLKLSISSQQLIVLDHPHDICHTGQDAVKIKKEIVKYAATKRAENHIPFPATGPSESGREY